MDAELAQAVSQVKLATMALLAREKRLKKTTNRMSRHYSKLAHTFAARMLLEEVAGMLQQDPDLWDEEPEIAPF